MSFPHRVPYRTFAVRKSPFSMQTISINLIVPQGWHELDDAQLRYVYSLIAKEFSADEIKTLALLKWATLKVRVEGLGVREKYVK